MRADARRNAELLIATARDVFTEKGAEAPMDEIARRAGVGAGTLYRHFPTRESLVEAVYRDEVGALADRADVLLAELGPARALPAWIREQVEFINHRHGLATTLKAALQPGSDMMEFCRQRLLAAAGALVDAGRAAGTVRPDVQPFDLLRLCHGLAIATQFGDTEDAERMLNVLIDGLAVGA